MSLDHSSSGSAPRRTLLSTPTAEEVGKKRTAQFLSEVTETPAKRGRLDVLNDMKKLERERAQLKNRVSAKKQRVRELVKAIETDETRMATIAMELGILKAENAE